MEVDDEPQSDVALDIFERVVSLEGHAPLYTELLQERSLDGYTPFMAAVTFKVNVCCTTNYGVKFSNIFMAFSGK